MKLYNDYSDKEALQRLKSGDKAAFSTLYYRHVSKLAKYIIRTAKSPFLAEDIVHDTFVKIWENRDQIDPEKPLEPYLYTIARRLLLNLLKRAQHETVILSEISKYAKSGENYTSIQFENSQNSKILQDAINALTGQPREVFIRCRMQGMSYSQAANELGITTSTVNKHMSKALQQIREYFRKHHAISLLLIPYISS